MNVDFLIVGAGIAGAGLAFRLAPHGRTVLLDMEEQAGYHTTGRSAAFYAETYGGPKLQPLTTASKEFLTSPPDGFTDAPLMNKLGAIHVFKESQRAQAEAVFEEMREALPGVRMLTEAQVRDRAPHLKPGVFVGGIDDPDCGDLDVAALHQAYLRAAKKQGAEVFLGAGMEAAAHDGTFWHVKTRTGQVKARVLVNCAGAWADDIAKRAGVSPLGLKPLRRTIITVPKHGDVPFDRFGPVIIDVDEAFYFKPEGNGYLISPADESESQPCDAQPELEDVAIAAMRFEEATGLTVEKIDAKWAGLRTFASDKAPVIGYDAGQPAFFWNVGQGGYGIQTSPAWSELAAALILKQGVPDTLARHGVSVDVYRPERLR
ncbi:NAD(P)/FAD-dependent oxidoreductase [Kordiimonas lacus]|uniref:Glycine/D-amino acid oxidase n=1 Tax=Kordiimonas lacus TaxID=637679 RepID=A0A1G6Y918_9PROT|nr:FAD-binding oxidoreductase [Kordiimonas lacus]SDD86065.1 Glycine/D-amino acid oxidase [Kordiimonas lacus]